MRTRKSNDTSKPSSKPDSDASGVFKLDQVSPVKDVSETGLEDDDVPLDYDEYEERYIAFIDILGFKELIFASVARDNPHEPSSLASIFNALSLDFHGFARDHSNADGVDLKTNTFSDFVVVSTRADDVAGLDVLLFVVWCIVRTWLSRGYLSRGGVAKGKVIHKGATVSSPGVVFGPAFLEAYKIENEIADFPRVILSKGVRREFDALKREGIPQRAFLSSKLVTRCKDGPLSVDPFAHLRVNGFGFLGKDHENEVSQFSRTLNRQIEHSSDVPHWHRKSLWLADVFNCAIDKTNFEGYTVSISN